MTDNVARSTAGKQSRRCPERGVGWFGSRLARKIADSRPRLACASSTGRGEWRARLQRWKALADPISFRDPVTVGFWRRANPGMLNDVQALFIKTRETLTPPPSRIAAPIWCKGATAPEPAPVATERLCSTERRLYFELHRWVNAELTKTDRSSARGEQPCGYLPYSGSIEGRRADERTSVR